MSVAAMSDEPRKAPYRINMIITVVYISSITVGQRWEALGSDRNLCGVLDSTRSDDSLGDSQLRDKAS
jgi:hypothetical protein